MTDQELRAMVRDAIARTSGASEVAAGRQVSDRQMSLTHQAPDTRAAFALFPLPRGGDADGLCIIEPSVRCTHCGYCQTYGH